MAGENRRWYKQQETERKRVTQEDNRGVESPGSENQNKRPTRKEKTVLEVELNRFQ